MGVDASYLAAANRQLFGWLGRADRVEPGRLMADAKRDTMARQGRPMRIHRTPRAIVELQSKTHRPDHFPASVLVAAASARHLIPEPLNVPRRGR